MLQYININTQDLISKAINDGVDRVFSSLYMNPLLRDPTIVKAQIFTSGTDLIVYHKLNRPVTGYIMIQMNAAAIIYTSSTVNPAPTAQIILKSNANVTADILFF